MRLAAIAYLDVGDFAIQRNQAVFSRIAQLLNFSVRIADMYRWQSLGCATAKVASANAGGALLDVHPN